MPERGDLRDWPTPVLCAITDPDWDEDGLVQRVEQALAGGVDVIQLRAPGRPAGEVWKWAESIRPACRRHGALLIINDRLDVALAVAAHGCHLGQASLPPSAARRVISGPPPFLGVSTHSLTEAEAAVGSGADYLHFGHVFSTGSKPGLPPRGLDQLRTVASAVEVPVIAVGGIDAHNVADVLAAGASGVAVISAIMHRDDPASATATLREALGSATS